MQAVERLRQRGATLGDGRVSAKALFARLQSQAAGSMRALVSTMLRSAATNLVKGPENRETTY
jgi:hypothetical protein